MRIVILGAGGSHRTEAALARAAGTLGHRAWVVDAPGWRRRLGRWGAPVIRALVERARPELILCTRHASAAGPALLDQLCGRHRSVFWYFDAPSPLPEPVLALGRRVDRVFATYGHQVEAFRAAGLPRVEFLPQGMDPWLDRPAARAPRRYRCDVAFVGSGRFSRRHDLLQRLAQRVRLQIRGPDWDGAPATLPVRGGRVRGRAFARVVLGSSIMLGIDALPATAVPPGGTSNRLWRVLGSGGFFLGEHSSGVERFARHGEHAIWYHSPDEAVALAAEYLADPDRRLAIARAGRAHALAAHTYAHRLERLLAGQGYTST
jgi:Glycosyl transferases group 1/DUF based on E. rectale Gene description (DUF3880)